MYSWLFEKYNLYYDPSGYDTNSGAGYAKIGYNPTVGLPDGSFPIHVKHPEQKEKADEEKDVHVDDVNLSSKLGPVIAQKTDTGPKRVDRSSFVSNARLTLAEEIESTNPARKGMSPYRYKGIIQRANTLNQNGRIYPQSILEREIINYQKLIQEN